MHNQRARPTVRLLREDLTDGWPNGGPARSVQEGRLADLHPLSDLPHPLIRKARELLTADTAEDASLRPIARSGDLRLLEVKVGQWRGGVWTDPDTGVRWLCAGGLAKGDHADHDDFYNTIGAVVEAGGSGTLMPTETDRRLLNTETVAAAVTDWELEVQADILRMLNECRSGGRSAMTVRHPTRPTTLGRVVLECAADSIDDEPCEAYTVEVLLDQAFSGSDLGWHLTVVILSAVHPPSEEWDRFNDRFFNLADVGALERRIEALRQHVDRREVMSALEGDVSHYAHKVHLAERTVNGRAVRALCGAFFVPMRDPMNLDECPTCAERLPAE